MVRSELLGIVGYFTGVGGRCFLFIFNINVTDCLFILFFFFFSAARLDVDNRGYHDNGPSLTQLRPAVTSSPSLCCVCFHIEAKKLES